MKVLQVNTVCGYGSTGRIAVDLAKFIVSKGDICEIAYGRSTDNTGFKNTYYIGSDMDHNAHGLLSRVTDRQGFYSKKATQRFIEHIREYNPDIIHLHNLHGYYLNIPSFFRFLKEFKKPVIWTMHDCWPFTGHCTYFDTVNCDRWKTECYDCPQKKEYPTSLLLDSSRRNYHEKSKVFQETINLHIVTPSSWLKDLVAQSFLRNKDCRVINNGIDLTRFSREEGVIRKKYGLEDKKIFLGVASIWGERKGFQDFIELSKMIDNDTIIILVGVNENQKSMLPKSIIGVERTNNVHELCQYYSDADYFLNLTYQDNFPTANIEALACGTPVVTYNTGGSVEIADNQSGIIIEKGDLKKIISLNKGLFKPKDCISRSKCFDSINQYQKYYVLYSELFKKSKLGS